MKLRRDTQTEVRGDTGATPETSARGGRRLEPSADDGSSLILYGILLKSRWRTIATLVLASFVLTFVITQFLIRPTYRAQAVIRPVSPADELGTIGRGMAGSGLGITSLEGLAGGFSQRGAKAHEYMSILRSYDFTMSLVDRHGLATLITPEGSWFDIARSKRSSDWTLYLTMRKRFGCEYNVIAGNVELYFVDHNALLARKVLKLYVKSLRDKLRREQVTSAVAALAALRAEAGRTPDALLQMQLYRVMARQVQREKLAQVQADFAFMQIEEPVVPDVPYSPHPVADSIVIAIVALIFGCLGVIAKESFRQSLAGYKEEQSEAVQEVEPDRKRVHGLKGS